MSKLNKACKFRTSSVPFCDCSYGVAITSALRVSNEIWIKNSILLKCWKQLSKNFHSKTFSFCTSSLAILQMHSLTSHLPHIFFSIYTFFRASSADALFDNAIQRILFQRRSRLTGHAASLFLQNWKVWQSPTFCGAWRRSVAGWGGGYSWRCQPNENPFGFVRRLNCFTGKSSDAISLVEVHPVQSLKSSQLFLYSHLVSCLEHPTTTFGDLMRTGW